MGWGKSVIMLKKTQKSRGVNSKPTVEKHKFISKPMAWKCQFSSSLVLQTVCLWDFKKQTAMMWPGPCKIKYCQW